MKVSCSQFNCFKICAGDYIQLFVWLGFFLGGFFLAFFFLSGSAERLKKKGVLSVC